MRRPRRKPGRFVATLGIFADSILIFYGYPWIGGNPQLAEASAQAGAIRFSDPAQACDSVPLRLRSPSDCGMSAVAEGPARAGLLRSPAVHLPIPCQIV